MEACAQALCNPDINTANNRFSAGQGYSYDQNGNVVQDAEGQRFAYDAENHQTKFFAVGNGSTEPDATYSYDGEGRRVKKVSATETTVFVYNASGQLVAEYSTQISQNPQVSYLTADHLGSPRVVTDQLGAIKDRKDYSAFGEETISAQRTTALNYTGGGTSGDDLKKAIPAMKKTTKAVSTSPRRDTTTPRTADTRASIR